MILKTLKEFLDSNGVQYEHIEHGEAFSAQETAAQVHCPGREMAKTVVVILQGDAVLCVLPASYNINFVRLSDALGTGDVYLASEEEFEKRFPGCELGAMPPFGNLFGLDTYVAASLSEDEYIDFNAGTHSDLIRMRYRDFDHLVHPRVLSFTTRGVLDNRQVAS